MHTFTSAQKSNTMNKQMRKKRPRQLRRPGCVSLMLRWDEGRADADQRQPPAVYKVINVYSAA